MIHDTSPPGFVMKARSALRGTRSPLTRLTQREKQAIDFITACGYKINGVLRLVRRLARAREGAALLQQGGDAARRQRGEFL